MYNALSDTNTHPAFRACKSSDIPAYAETFNAAKRQRLSFDVDVPTRVQVVIDMTSWGSASSNVDVEAISGTTLQLSSYLLRHSARLTSLFANKANVVAGISVGSDLQRASAAEVLQTISCYPPCIFVFPPYSLATPTTIYIPPQ